MITLEDILIVTKFRNKFYKDPEPYWCEDEIMIRSMEQWALDDVVENLKNNLIRDDVTADELIFDKWFYYSELRDSIGIKPTTKIFYRFVAKTLRNLMNYLFKMGYEYNPFYWYDMEMSYENFGYDDYFIYERKNKND